MPIVPNIAFVDLRSFTRRPETCLTRVHLRGVGSDRIPWLVLGEAQLRPRRESHRDGRWHLSAYLAVGVVDFEHDAAYALSLPLVGVHFDGIEYQTATFTAWVDSDIESFRVPTETVDPRTLPSTTTCRKCADFPQGHPIVERFQPPIDKALYERTRGQRVEILIGPA